MVCRFQQVERPADVRLDVKRRLRDRGSDPGAGSQVNDGVERPRCDDPLNGGLVDDIRAMDRNPLAYSGEITLFPMRIVKVVEVVEDLHAMSVVEQTLNKVRTDKAGAAGDEDIHNRRRNSDTIKRGVASGKKKTRELRHNRSKYRCYLPVLAGFFCLPSIVPGAQTQAWSDAGSKGNQSLGGFS